MYAGRKVEEAPVAALFDRPLHPYTRALMASMPSMNSAARLAEIPGMVPSPIEPRSGCSFAPRCSYATDRCRREAPALRQYQGEDHVVACFEAERVAASALDGATA
jgi:peptide/nickel transport system ATP-binding protein